MPGPRPGQVRWPSLPLVAEKETAKLSEKAREATFSIPFRLAFFSLLAHQPLLPLLINNNNNAGSGASEPSARVPLSQRFRPRAPKKTPRPRRRPWDLLRSSSSSGRGRVTIRGSSSPSALGAAAEAAAAEEEGGAEAEEGAVLLFPEPPATPNGSR